MVWGRVWAKSLHVKIVRNCTEMIELNISLPRIDFMTFELNGKRKSELPKAKLNTTKKAYEKDSHGKI